MRRAAWGVPVAVLVAWVVGGAEGGAPPPARAQAPPVEIHRVQDADFAPANEEGRPIFVLALGSDARPGEPVDRLRADSIHIVALNPQERAATILGFPRDSYVDVPGTGTRRINEGMFYGGPELMVEAVQGLTGVPIDFYMLTSFRGLINMVKGIGGIPIEILYPMSDEDAGTDLEPGRRKLSGGEALAFTRDRHSAPLGDFGRSENQGRLMVAALAKLRRGFARDPSVLLRWIQVGMANVQTNLSLVEVFDLAMAVLQVDPESVTNLVVPGGTGSAGGASVVFISDEAEGIYADLRDDGLVEGA